MHSEKMKELLGEAKAFAHGTVRQWQRGNVMKHGTEWMRLAKDKPAPLLPVAAVAATSLGGNPYMDAEAFTPQTSATLESLAAQMSDTDDLQQED